jgi:peptidoglycan/xylan/chitin deacetylase (PgdA/CDA1 family)
MTSENKRRGLDRFDNRFTEFAYSKIAFPLFQRTTQLNPLVIYYHIVSDRRVRHVDGLYSFRTVKEFEADLEVLLRFFRPVSLDDFLAYRAGRSPLPKKSVLLTFDDGLSECYSIIAPILKSKGIPALFFLCSAFVDNQEMAYDHKKTLLISAIKEKGLTAAQDRELKALFESVGIFESENLAALASVNYGRKRVLDEVAGRLNIDFIEYLKVAKPYVTSVQVAEMLRMGHAIGAHSIDHPRYTDVPLCEQLRQTRESVNFLTERFQIPYRVFSFPSSDAGVSRDFYEKISADVQICFGNRGFLDDCAPGSVQRTSMEKTSMGAEGILGKALFTRFVKGVVGQGCVKRPNALREPSKIQSAELSCV